MKLRRILGIALFAAGLLALIYGGFTYTEERHDVDVGPIEFAVEDKERVNIPVWLGAVAAIAGVVLIALPKR
jgi:drug/metabolite transporter (DMT)-like permease